MKLRRSQVRAVSACAVLALGCSLSFGLATAGADPAATAGSGTGAAKPLDPSAAATAIDLQRTDVRLTQATSKLADAKAAVASTLASLNVTLGEISVNDAALERVTDRLKQRSVVAYQHYGAGSASVLDIDDAADLSTARRYSDAAIDVDSSDLTDLKRVAESLEHERQQKAAANDDATAQRDTQQHLVDALTAQQNSDNSALAAAGAIPVMGTAQLSAAQIANWFRSTGALPHLAAGTTIDDVAALYVEEGAAEGVRGDLAFAQAIVETGSFSVAAGNNYSGIGVCDSCTGGYAFPTPRDGVRAQIQLLKNYADPDSRGATLAHPPAPALYGSDRSQAEHTYDSFFLKGKAPLWNLMGHGNWATDPTYAPKVIAVFNQMVLYANAHPEAP